MNINLLNQININLMIKEKHYDELKKLKEKISSIFEEIPDETEIIQSIIRMSNLETVSN